MGLRFPDPAARRKGLGGGGGGRARFWPPAILGGMLGGAAGGLLATLTLRRLARAPDAAASRRGASRDGTSREKDPTTDEGSGQHPDTADAVPGLPGREAPLRSVATYALGFLLAAGLTAASFAVAQGGFLYGPAVPIALVALAVAQIGVHIVFFLHVTTGPDHVNNVLALLFGTFVVMLVILGSLWIMSNLNHMIPHGGAAGGAHLHEGAPPAGGF